MRDQKKYLKKYYIRNKDKIIARSKNYYFHHKEKRLKQIECWNKKIGYNRRKEKYHSDKKYRDNLAVRASISHHNKFKKDKTWHDNEIKRSLELREGNQEETIPAPNYGRIWTENDMEFLKNNYKLKTVLELSLILGRTFYATNAEIGRLSLFKLEKRLPIK